jgi:hypothetical protein
LNMAKTNLYLCNNHHRSQRMKTCIFFFLVLFSAQVPAQMYINKSRKEVRRELEKQIAKNDSLHIMLAETDTSLVFSFKDAKVLPSDFVYSFDAAGRCNAEITIAYCDSCFSKFLQKVLSRKQFEWIKLNDRLYVSKYSKRLMLEVPAGNKDRSFTIRRMKWTRASYHSLLTTR